VVRQPRVTALCFGAAAILFCDMAWPQEAPPPVAFSSVTVQGLGNPATASYAKLLRGVDAFVAHRALAPKATLMFRAFDRAPHRAPLVLRLETEDRIIPITVDTEGRFTLPTPEEAGAREGDLVANRHSGELIIDPSVSTPGFTLEVARLGDRRLWCEVVCAIDKDDLPWRVKLLVSDGTSPCKNSRIKIYSVARTAQIQGAELMQGERKLALTIDGRANGFSAPMHDASWSNEALLRVHYAPASD
jgi:hypothetical protein